MVFQLKLKAELLAAALSSNDDGDARQEKMAGA